MSTQREAWLSQVTEEAIDPARAICDRTTTSGTARVTATCWTS